MTNKFIKAEKLYFMLLALTVIYQQGL
jgi:hypothetical protein